MVSVPVEVLVAPLALLALPPVAFPVMVSVPVEPLVAPWAVLALPPVAFPVMVSVPVDALVAPVAVLALPPVTFPVMVAEFSAVPEKVTQATVPAKTFAVSVTPLDRVNAPPAVAPPVVSLRTWPVLPRLQETLTVMAKLFAIRTSPAVKDGKRSPAVPLGVVAQTSVAFMFPALRA